MTVDGENRVAVSNVLRGYRSILRALAGRQAWLLISRYLSIMDAAKRFLTLPSYHPTCQRPEASGVNALRSGPLVSPELSNTSLRSPKSGKLLPFDLTFMRMTREQDSLEGPVCSKW